TATMTTMPMTMSSVTTAAAAVTKNHPDMKSRMCRHGSSWPDNDPDANYSDGAETASRQDTMLRCARWRDSSSPDGVVLEDNGGVTILKAC
ncbi:hypothetical protein X777_09000, partial [Ooceraea biroi]